MTAVYGPSQTPPVPPADVTEIYLPASRYNVTAGVGAGSLSWASPADEGGSYFAVPVPSTWNTVDVVLVVQAQTDAAAGDIALAVFAGINLDASNLIPQIGTNLVVASSGLLTPTEVELAAGVAVPGEWFAVNVGRPNDPADTFSGYVSPYGLVLRKAS